MKQLTSQPIRFLINTETHNDHVTGNFVFSPPAVVIGSAGATAGIKNYYDPKRNEKLMAESSEMREAFRGFRVVPPHVEFNDRMILNMGDRTLELIQLKNIHSDADTAIWLPKERVLFSAATAAVKRFGFLRPFVTIDNIKSDIKKLKALNPDVVVPAHGRPTTVQLLDETDKFYDVLLERVGKQIAARQISRRNQKRSGFAGIQELDRRQTTPRYQYRGRLSGAKKIAYAKSRRKHWPSEAARSRPSREDPSKSS